MKILSFSIQDLFGIFQHKVVLKDGGLTIILGPNGFGKTTLLKLLRDFFSGTFAQFDAVPFSLFEINFDDGRSVIVSKGYAKRLVREPTHVCTFGLVESGNEIKTFELDIENLDHYITAKLRERAPYITKVGSDLWEDTRDGEIIETDDLISRYSLRMSHSEKQKLPDWLSEIISSVDVRLIETQRLTQSEVGPRLRRPSGRPGLRTNDTVTDYSQQLARKVQTQFNEYATLSGQLDRTFVLRLLTQDFSLTDNSFPENSLEQRIGQLNEKRKRLRDSGLLSQEDQPLPAPREGDHTVDQILSAYLQDVENKLAVFDQLLEKLELLREIIDGRMEYKKIIISRQLGFEFRSVFEDSRIPPTSLSSGEQHILILVYDLLFNEKENSLILVDEPEISLHVDWQLSFLSDLKKIGAVVPRNIVLATHSPQIISSNWDLTGELERPRGALGNHA